MTDETGLTVEVGGFEVDIQEAEVIRLSRENEELRSFLALIVKQQNIISLTDLEIVEGANDGWVQVDEINMKDSKTGQPLERVRTFRWVSKKEADLTNQLLVSIEVDTEKEVVEHVIREEGITKG